MTSIDFVDRDRFVLKQAYLLLTRRCNLTCSHCIRSSGPHEKGYIDFDLAKNIISQIANEKSSPTLMLSGGEPTLHPDFFELLSYSLKNCHQVVINTNGLRINNISKFKDSIKKPIIQISIDGESKVHELIRGKSTFSKAIKNIDTLSKEGFYVVVATTVGNNNIESISNLDKELASVNFSRWNIKRVVGSGRADDSDDVSTVVWNDFVEKLGEYVNFKKIRSHKMYSLNSLNKLKSEYQKENRYDLALKGANCGTGRSKLYINPNGTVYPCACMEGDIVADFNNVSLGVIKNILSTFEIEPSLNSICFNCSAWSRCQGGCPGISRRNNKMGDPRCPIVNVFSKGFDV